MTSQEVSWWDVYLIQLYPCYVNDISRCMLAIYFCGASDTSDKSDTSSIANSSDKSKTSATVTRLSR